MDTLSALDAQFLHLEDDVTTLHIGGVAVFEGPAPTYDEFVASFEAKLPRIPRYRQKVASVPLGLGRPIWVDDEHFAVRSHVLHTALPSPGGDAALTTLVGRLMGHRLDRNRPLWQIWLVEGLADGRWALVFKVHHCMVDGVAGVGLLHAVLDLDPHAEIPPLEPWVPQPPPAPVDRVRAAWAGALADVGRMIASVPAAVTDPAETAKGLADTAKGVVGFTKHVAPTPHLSIEGGIGPGRSWAHSSVRIADIKTVRTALGGTLNDVVLACVARGFRDLLRSRGDDPDQAVVRTEVPVSVRREDGEGVPDNRVSLMLIELPVHLADPTERLDAVRGAMAEAKASHMADLGEAVTHLADLAPPLVLQAVSRVAAQAAHRVHQRIITTVTTNVPGPQFPLYCLGRHMEAYLPYVPIADGARVGVAILSYDGVIAFGVTGDQDSVPEVAVVAAGAARELDDLLALVGAPAATTAATTAAAPEAAAPKRAAAKRAGAKAAAPRPDKAARPRQPRSNKPAHQEP